MVSTASICSCNCHFWEQQKYNFHPYIYDIVGLILIIIFVLIIMLSKGPWIVTCMITWVSKIFNSCLVYLVKISRLLWHSMDIATCRPMGIKSWKRRDPVRARCYQYRKLCELWIDYSELLCYLYQVDQLNPVLLDCCCGIDNHRSNKYKTIYTTSLLDHLDSLPQGYETLISCLKMSVEKPDCHIGHFSLLELLIADDVALLESTEYKHNLAIREIIKVNLSVFVTLTNINQLLPLLEKRQLLTDDDKDILRNTNTTSSDKARYLLIDFLHTKGHQGYIRYFECLQEEQSHCGHPSILRIITKSLHDQNICVPEVSVDRGVRIWFKTKGILGTKEYFLVIEELTFICLSNNSIKLNQKIDTFIESHNTPETKAVGTLMKGFRFKLLGEFNNLYDLKTEIECYIQSMKVIENKKLITGKWFLLLSCLKRHEGKFEEARALLDRAKAELFFIASGDDLAHVYYTEASLLIEESSCITLQGQKQKQIIALLHNSIKCSPSSSRGMSIRQAWCHLNLALCHMGSSFNYSHVTQKRSQLEKAKSSLTILEKQFVSLPLRLQMQYYTVNCDYCRGISNKHQALQSIKEGLRLDVDKRFKIDIQYLNDRIR
ncbi:uncharacterized protein [Dysidea avara]|uniref:uncharacterized protein n=1 Tax=Dysidea avara TaxID=196820 RepID=UPI0033211F54